MYIKEIKKKAENLLVYASRDLWLNRCFHVEPFEEVISATI